SISGLPTHCLLGVLGSEGRDGGRVCGAGPPRPRAVPGRQPARALPRPGAPRPPRPRRGPPGPPPPASARARPRPRRAGRALPAAGKVVWVTPPGAQGNRTAGIGVQFADTAEGENVRGKIETLLAGTLNADKATHTM